MTLSSFSYWQNMLNEMARNVFSIVIMGGLLLYARHEFVYMQIDGWRLNKIKKGIRNWCKEWKICYCVTQMDFFFPLMTLQLTLHIKRLEFLFFHFFSVFTESLAQEMELERKNRQASENDVKGSLQERSNYYKNPTLYAT